jgi:hypothetical protein
MDPLPVMVEQGIAVAGWLIQQRPEAAVEQTTSI